VFSTIETFGAEEDVVMFTLLVLVLVVTVPIIESPDAGFEAGLENITIPVEDDPPDENPALELDTTLLEVDRVALTVCCNVIDA
jgi:hypothetical protein